jgi:O-antigen/teichoic acid export membrane protein
MQMAQPGLAELRTREAPARVLQAASALTQAVLIGAGAIACGVVVVNYGFVRLWVGEAQWGGYGLMLLILLRMLLANWNLATGSAIYAFGYQRRLALVGIADGILYVAITGALVRTLGPSGAPLAGILTVVALQLPFNLHALARETGVTTLGLAWSLWPWAWRFAVAFAFATALGRIWRPTGIVELAVAGSVAVAAYGLLMVRRVQQPPVSRYLHPQVHSLLRRLPRALRAPGA